jgi:diguanylate cyclase (GGDEF)-like protein
VRTRAPGPGSELQDSRRLRPVTGSAAGAGAGKYGHQADGVVVPDDGYRGGWLCPTKADRVRLTDMSPAVRRARVLAGGFCGFGVLLLVPWCGWVPVAMFVLVPGPLLAIDRLLRTVSRPERLVAASLALYVGLILAGVAVSGGDHSPLLPWIAIPIVTAAARFRLPVFLTGAAVAAIGLLLAVLLGTPGELLANPSPVVAVVVLLAALVVAQQPLLDAELRWRRDAVLDPLTGLLNRQGLQRRFQEVAEQARLTASPVSLIMCDLDNFKAVNDAHGHARGDAVLKEVAYLLRKELRAFELLYRFGGEELLLILPGAELDEAHQIAEQARLAIANGQPGGLTLTASFGVCTTRGSDLEFKTMFDDADRSLYQAKNAGRNQVGHRFSEDDPATISKLSLQAVEA